MNIGDVFVITAPGYKAERWVVIKSKPEYVMAATVKEVEGPTNPDGWANLYLTTETINCYQLRHQLRLVGVKEVAHP